MTFTAHSELAILVPVLRRPHRVRPLLESICNTVPHHTLVVFVCDKDDHEEQRAIHASLYEGEYGPLEVKVMLHDGGYAAKVNAAVAITDSSLVLLAADDLEFHDGWFDAAIACLRDQNIHVVGLNDLIERDHRPEHATHFLMTRDYASRPTIDGRPGPLHAGYRAWYTDDELIGTATKRGVYIYCPDSHVEHKHPMNGTALDDDTYKLARSYAREDRREFRKRETLWT